MPETKDIGLRGIPVADTKICVVDGEKGKLIYRGYDINELAQYSSFEETVYLLLYETLPTKKELELFREALTFERQLPVGIIRHLKTREKSARPMDVLQSVIRISGCASILFRRYLPKRSQNLPFTGRKLISFSHFNNAS
ncbi:MAG: citrate/2-methylcitrate synthase [Candidatus Methanoperedens sp.]